MRSHRFMFLLGLMISGAVYFAIWGMPYDSYHWTNKVWAGQIYDPPADDPAFKQNTIKDPTTVVVNDAGFSFLARQDSNGDGVINELDALQFFFLGQDGMLQPIGDSSSGAEHFVVLPDGSVVVLVAGDNDLKLLQIAPDGTLLTETPLQFFETRNLIAGDGVIWFLGNSETNNPPIFFSIDPTTGEILSERQLERSNTELVIDESGQYILGFTPANGLIRLFNLQNLGQPLSFGIRGDTYAGPIWSATGGKVAFVFNNPSGAGIIAFIIDATTVGNATYPVRAFAGQTRVDLQWSTNGQFVVVGGLYPELGLPVYSPLTIIDTNNGDDYFIEEANIVFSIVGWSQNDILLVSKQDRRLGSAPPKSYVLIDPATGDQTDIDLGNNSPLYVSWLPNGAAVAALVETPDGNYALLRIDAETGESEIWVTSDDPLLATASLLFSPDGTQVFLYNNPDDPLASELGVTSAIYVLDLETGVVTQLSPEEIAVQ